MQQTFRVVLAIDEYSLRDRGIQQAFRLIYANNLFLILALNSGSYIQRQLVSTQRKDNTLYVDESANGSEFLMWHHCMNPVHSEVERKHLSVRMSYRTGNLIGFWRKGKLRP